MWLPDWIKKFSAKTNVLLVIEWMWALHKKQSQLTLGFLIESDIAGSHVLQDLQCGYHARSVNVHLTGQKTLFVHQPSVPSFFSVLSLFICSLHYLLPSVCFRWCLSHSIHVRLQSMGPCMSKMLYRVYSIRARPWMACDSFTHRHTHSETTWAALVSVCASGKQLGVTMNKVHTKKLVKTSKGCSAGLGWNACMCASLLCVLSVRETAS